MLSPADKMILSGFLLHRQMIRISLTTKKNRIGGVMVSVIASSAVDRGFEPRSGQTKNYEIAMRCFSAKHTALRRNSKDYLA